MANLTSTSTCSPSERSDLVKLNSIIHGNIRGILNGNLHKLCTIKDIAIERNSFMINLTESHLNPSTDLIESEIKGWEQVRCDSKQRLGGGVICYVKETLPISNCMTFSNGYCEIVCFLIEKLNIANISVYRPPGCSNVKFIEAIEKI